MATLKRPTKRGGAIRLSICLPLFLCLVVVLNIAAAGLWFMGDKSTNRSSISSSSSPSNGLLLKNPQVHLLQGFHGEGPPKEETDTNTVRMHEKHGVDSLPSEQEELEEEEEETDEHSLDATSQKHKQHQPDAPVAVIAHVVSLIKCSKSVTGFLDAAAVFRHSIHQQSFLAGRSKYSYQMYAIVHENCKEHGDILKNLGYTVLIKPPLLQVNEIKGKWYRDHVEYENCCGSAEFIKLYAYELVHHEIVVHWDMDVAVLQPMDDLFDAMLLDKDTAEGQAARKRLQLQHPNEPLPDRIDAFFTRDITSAQPWEKVQGVQGGFLIARPSKEVLKTYLNFIKVGNYTGGRGDGTGWNSMGYGGFQGAMAYQGVVAFYYDFYAPKTAVELDVCRWNQVVADVIWRGPEKMEHHMQCREYPRDGVFETNTKCDDCRITPIDQVKTVHYTACRKPWECALPHPRVPRDERQKNRLSHLTNITTCGLLFRKWFELRQNLEEQLQGVGKVNPAEHKGEFFPDYFLGYCSRQGSYIPMNPPTDGFDMKQIYGI